MCPHKMFDWFDRNPDWRESDREEAERIVRARWTESYAMLAQQVATKAPDPPISQLCRTSSKWAAHSMSDEEDGEDNFTCPNSIDAYLDSPRVSKTELNAAGGVLQYWENARATRPRLAQMALGLLSAPGMIAHKCLYPPLVVLTLV
jgi:hypothetical protein